MWKSPVEILSEALTSKNLRRAYVITNPITHGVEASDPMLQPLADAVARDSDYRGHQGCFFEIGKESGHLLSAHIHRTLRGQAAGGVRYWSYSTVGDFVRDGLRLSLGMGQKCALAGLWWGGGKGVIARRRDRDHRDKNVRDVVYRDFGRFVSGLRGCYITAEDVGTTPEDMAAVFSTTRYTTCITPDMGGSGNPSILTATGVVVAMEAALEHLGLGTIEGKTVAVQGLGNVSLCMIGDLLERGVKQIIGVDIDPVNTERIRSRFPSAPLHARTIEPDDPFVFSARSDILAPNAVGAALNARTIPVIEAPIVCGAANNQLEDPGRDARALHERGILFVPDFLANRMGIVNCSNEQYGAFDGDPAIYAHLGRDMPSGIFRRCMDVFKRSAGSGRTPAEEAESLAEELSRQPHPIWGNRGQQIIDSLVANNWAREEPIS
jgi:glutamate dehydrogenase/leucine dehydrogenase